LNYRDAYQSWLRDFASDEALCRELRAIENDEAEIEDRFYADLSFGTAGMRGVIGAGRNRMNAYNVRRASLALAKYIQREPGRAERGVAIAYDSRRFSPEFAEQAALSLCAGGVKAFLFDSLRPVPILSFAVRHLRAIAGIVITASHNPKQYNGYKVYWEDGGQMPPEQASEVELLIGETNYAEAVAMDKTEALERGLLTYIGAEVDDAYQAMLQTLIISPALIREMGGQIKIVYTPLHGSGNIPVRRALQTAGFTEVYAVPEQEAPDPDFPTVDAPNPEDPGVFRLAIALQKKINADLVFGTDPDCDRVGVAVHDASGDIRTLTGNEIGCLLLHYILSQRKAAGTLPGNAAAVKSIVSTEMARAICDDYGAAMIDVLTGFKYIAEQIQSFEETGSHTFVFGFEESYGYLSGTEVRDKDAVNASLLIAEMAAYYKRQGMTLIDALTELNERYGWYGAQGVSYELKGKDGLQKSERLMRSLHTEPPERFGEMRVLAVRDYLSGARIAAGKVEPLTLPQSDVLYYELEDGAWICVRPSGTEPKIKLYVNAKSLSAAATEELLARLSAAGVEELGRRLEG